MSKEIDVSTTYNAEVEKLFEEIAIEEGLHDYNINKSDGSVKGDGYNGIISSATIAGKNKSNQNKFVHLVIKSASKSDALRKEVSVGNLYIREIYMYNTILCTFETMQVDKGLIPCPLAPKFFKGISVDKNETLILENLKEMNYHLYERRIPMDHDHISLVMSRYGYFHALSFALRDQQPNKFKAVVGSMDDHFVKDMTRNNFIDNFVTRCVAAQTSLDANTDKNAIQIYKTFIGTINQFLVDLPNSVDDHSVVLHGDCWTNNMMFQYGDSTNGSKPTNVRFLDFQITRLGSPVLDLSYFLYTCSPKEIINNFDHYLRSYYDSFALHLRKLGSDPDKLLPYHVLQLHWKKYAKYGLIFALLVIHLMLSEENEVIDFADVSESVGITKAFDYKLGKSEEYNDRVRPIILHFVENSFF